ncbi:MAG: nucleoside 2-deoxyribosyltransferase [Candidatus Bathyarchaeia archaeon]
MVMTKRVFISGPIQGMEDQQSYRDRISSLLVKYGYEPVDPWRRERILYQAPLDSDWWSRVPPREFIRRDLEDIDRCDALIAYLPKLSAGTCMELFYAKMRGKKTITICKIRNPSPWIIEHSDIIVKSFKDLERILKEGI